MEMQSFWFFIVMKKQISPVQRSQQAKFLVHIFHPMTEVGRNA